MIQLDEHVFLNSWGELIFSRAWENEQKRGNDSVLL